MLPLTRFGQTAISEHSKTIDVGLIAKAIISILVLTAFSSASRATHKTNHTGGPGGPGGGEDPVTACDYPAFSDKPSDKLQGSAADFSVQYGSVVDGIKNNAGPDWDESGMLGGNGFVETMKDVQHRIGNQGIDESGDACGTCTPVGKRLSAWYDGDPDFALVTTETNGFSLNGKVITEAAIDPTRPGTSWANSRLYTAWLSTFQRQYVDGNGLFGTAKPGSISFKPPMYLETKVSFEDMLTPGFRVSMWMMPVERPGDEFATPSIAYDGNYTNGFEIDIFEFEPVSVIEKADPEGDVVCANLIEFSWINGFHTGKGKTPSGLDGKNHFEGPEEGYCSDNQCSLVYGNPDGIGRPDINVGKHTIGLLWTEDTLAWSFNNELVLEITDPTMIPTREHYLIVSREMTNGLSEGQLIPDPADETNWGTYLPAEPGLYGWNGNSDIGSYIANIDSDKALIQSIEIWGEIKTE